MRIGFIVNHPTQFEVPFYQYVAKEFPTDSFEIFYLKEQENQHFDKELGQQIKWGFDLFEGYPHQFLSTTNALKEFKEKLLQKHFDLIIVNGYKNQYQDFAKICSAVNVKVALRLDTVLFNQAWWKIILRRLLLAKAYRQFDHFLVTGKVSRDYILKMGVKESQINIFSYCVDNQFFNISAQEDSPYFKNLVAQYKAQGEKVILSVAKFVGRESPWDILNAFIAINRQDLSLVLIGDGSEKEALMQLAADHPLLKIFFPGYIPYIHLREYYKLSRIFIHAAKDEPWGVSVQEAMAGNCFVICSDKVGASFDLLVNGRNGFTYQFGDAKALAHDIERGLNIPKELVSKTNQEILSHWNYDLMWNEILKAAKPNYKS